MPFFLLAAEADQIQDFIFRASRLREVVGGSQLLSRFCKDGAARLLKHHGGEPVINDGGAFRVLFQDEDNAHDFGRDLAELYRRCTGSSMTVAKPVPYDGSVPAITAEDKKAWQAASDQAQRELRKAKSRGDVAATAAHLPYLAFCASCGVTVALQWHQRHQDQRANYYCAACRWKEEERDAEYKQPSEWISKDSFIGQFLETAAASCGLELEGLAYSFPSDAEDVAQFDVTGRRYVAYLIADGNGMGKLFSACPDPETMRKLSTALPEVLRQSLAVTCGDLLERIKEKNEKRILPVLPLILGGDDLFALLPASWAIDCAARFCRKYESLLAGQIGKLQIPVADGTPTIAAAIVICKSNYPYTLAHRRGEELLVEAKQLARKLESQVNAAKRARVSVLNFELITGNEVGGLSAADSPLLRPSARPYFTVDDPSEALQGVGLPIRSLLTQRLLLAQAELPGKRLAEFAEFYHQAAIFEEENDLRQEMKPSFEELLKRIPQRKAVEDALRALNGRPVGDNIFWGSFARVGELFIGHGFADLLTIWDYAYDVTKDLSKYGGY